MTLTLSTDLLCLNNYPCPSNEINNENTFIMRHTINLIIHDVEDQIQATMVRNVKVPTCSILPSHKFPCAICFSVESIHISAKLAWNRLRYKNSQVLRNFNRKARIGDLELGREKLHRRTPPSSHPLSSPLPTPHRTYQKEKNAP